MVSTVFITYSHKDEEFKDRVVTGLDYHENLEIVFDERVIRPGDPLSDLYGEIGNSDALISILSDASINSGWVKKEMDIAMSKDPSDEFEFIPVIAEGSSFDDILDQLEDKYTTYLKNVLVGRFDKDFQSTLNGIANKLSEEEPADEVYYSVEGERGNNPFRRVRTEYFENEELLAHFFAKPEPKKYNRIMEIFPTLAKGGRGSGKTMALKSLEAKVCLLRSGEDNFEEASMDFFGTYCRLSQGSFETQSDDISDHIPIEAASKLFKSEIILRLVESTIDEIQEAKQLGILSENIESEQNLIKEISTPLRLETDVSTLEDVRDEISENLNEISDYVNDKIIDDDPSYDGVWLDKENLRDVCRSVSDFLPGGSSYTIYFMLDEYENLRHFQKTVVNTLIKWSESGYFSFKIASKKPCFNNPKTLEDQELEESHDYNTVDLDYDIKNDKKEYKNLITKITSKIFEKQGYSGLSIESVFEERPQLGGIPQDKIDEKIIEIRDKDQEWWEELDEHGKKEQRGKYSMAAFYKLHSGQNKRDFGGVDEMAKLSSGIIRHFLELCGVSFHFALQETEDPLDDGISVENQTDAAYLLSEFYLDFIGGNVEMYGPQLRRLVIDLGDIFREKLENHSSEPEAARITITNPERLDRSEEVEKLLNKAEEHSVLRKESGRGGMRPKNKSEQQPVTYTLNRVFTPALEISPNYRWRTKFKVEDIEELMSQENRNEAKDRIRSRVSDESYDSQQQRFSEY